MCSEGSLIITEPIFSARATLIQCLRPLARRRVKCGRFFKKDLMFIYSATAGVFCRVNLSMPDCGAANRDKPSNLPRPLAAGVTIAPANLFHGSRRQGAGLDDGDIVTQMRD